MGHANLQQRHGIYISFLGGIALFFFPASPLFCEGRDDFQKIIAAQEGIKSLEASFVQTKALSLFEETIESRGCVVIEKPGFYCWSYKEPEKRIFYVDGTRTGSLVPATGEREEVDLRNKTGLAAIIKSVTSIMTGSVSDSMTEDYDIIRNNASQDVYGFTFSPVKTFSSKHNLKESEFIKSIDNLLGSAN